VTRADDDAERSDEEERRHGPAADDDAERSDEEERRHGPAADDDAERSDEEERRTLLLIKPDAVARGLIGEIISRIERKGLTFAALELRKVSQDLARQHYAEHEGKAFFTPLLDFITSGTVVAAIVEGPRAIPALRQIAGATDPVAKAAPGTIRGDFALETQFNLVHGSDSAESARREIALWFPDHR